MGRVGANSNEDVPLLRPVNQSEELDSSQQAATAAPRVSTTYTHRNMRLG